MIRYDWKVVREPPEPEPLAEGNRELFLVSEVTSTQENQVQGGDLVAGQVSTWITETKLQKRKKNIEIFGRAREGFHI